MNKELIQTLQDFGLEEKEAKVYLAMLGLGEATAAALAEKTILDRTLMYQIATKLIEKGVASYIVKNNVRYFKAASPEALLKILQEKEQKLKKALPELNAYRKSINVPTKVEIFRGREGINTILRTIIREEEHYYILGGATEACSIFELENVHFVKEAKRAKVKGKILARKNDRFFIGENEEYRFVPDELISSTTMILWGNKTAIFIWAEPYNAIVIDNKEITEGNLATFNYLWKQAEVPSKPDKQKKLLET